MTAADLSAAGSKNLFHTYFSLGMSAPGSTISHEAGFDACLGNFDHPICNFAGRIQLDPWVANRLVELAIERRTFNVYSTPGDSPSVRELRDELLVRAGFRKNYSLQQLFWEPRRVEVEVAFEAAETLPERREIANFMANQFFNRHSSSFRRRIAEATLGATDLPLYAIYHRNEMIASLMLVEDENVLGLFNLCVKPHLQNRGWGKLIVGEVQRRANEKGKFVNLQCDETLTSWYERQGFERSGWVDVYGLSDERRVAIIN